MTQASTSPYKEEQFKTWVRQYSDMLYAHAMQRGFDQDAAKDLVQETFVSAWKGADQFEQRASAKNWLFVILKNKITDHYRKTASSLKRQNVEVDPYFDEAGHWAKSVFPKEFVVDPNLPSDVSDFHKIFEACSRKLTALHKTVFFMKYVDELESDTICLELAITSNNYWTILHRAKVQLRACLEKNWLQGQRI